MKIQQSFAVSGDRVLAARERGKESPVFQALLQEKQTLLSHNRLQSLFQHIERQGTRLGHSQSLQDLMTYKQTIRDFLNEVVQHAIAVEDHRGQHPNGREKQLKLITQVDEKLLDLSNDILDKQASSINILAKIGEIKGLLVNLYL